MGGDISVSSQLGVGTTFKVVLPLQNAEPPEFASQPAVLGDRRLRVLAAEDHPINLKFMSILLEKMGHEAAFCENGREALELVRAARPRTREVLQPLTSSPARHRRSATTRRPPSGSNSSTARDCPAGCSAARGV
jgi:hypothetical protein